MRPKIGSDMVDAIAAAEYVLPVICDFCAGLQLPRMPAAKAGLYVNLPTFDASERLV